MTAQDADRGEVGELGLARYHRQMLLPVIGEQGQRRLLASTAAVIGCGALGTTIANMLARAGVGHLVIADRDVVDVTNLQRQVLFDEADVAAGIPKAEAAKRKLATINSRVNVTAIVDDVNHTNIERYVAGCDVLVDGLDTFETRFLLNDVAVKHGIPYVYGGAVGTTGLTYAVLPHTTHGDRPWERAGKATPCLRCIFEQAPPPGAHPTCDTAGVLGSAASIIANYQVVQTLKILTGNWQAVRPTLLSVDVWMNEVKQLDVVRAYDAGECVCCEQRRFEYLAGQFASATTTLCGRNAVQLRQHVSAERLKLDELAERLRAHGEVSVNSFVLRAVIHDSGQAYELTLFADGRAIVKGTDSAATAKSIYAKYVGV